MQGWGVCGSGPYDVAFGVCDFSCAQIGDNSVCLDARSLTLPWYGLGVGRSDRVETYAPSAPPRSEVGHPMRWRSGDWMSAGVG